MHPMLKVLPIDLAQIVYSDVRRELEDDSEIEAQIGGIIHQRSAASFDREKDIVGDHASGI
jgi:hypothetical protein